jgi:hypothetical protein
MKKIKILLGLSVILPVTSDLLAFDMATLNSVLQNVQVVYSESIQIPNKLKDIEASVRGILPQVKCLPKPGGDECSRIGCANRKECAGVVLGNFVKLIRPATDTLLGTVDTEKQYHPGVIYATLDTLGKLPALIPDKFKTSETFKKVDVLTSKVKALNDKLGLFAAKVADMLTFLNGLTFVLNAEQAAKNIKVDPLPPVTLPNTGDEEEFTLDV